MDHVAITEVASSVSPRPARRTAQVPRGLHRLIGLALLAGLVPVLTGCSTHERSWEGVPANQVWTAMESVARNPDYDDPNPDRRWNVSDNFVRVLEDERRIEIVRVLDRRRAPRGGVAVDEARRWQFGVALEGGDANPVVTFRARNMSVPAHVADEARRYFEQLDRTLEPFAGTED